MSNPKLISYLEGMKKNFWHERRHLQQEEIKLQWAAKAAPLASILFNTEAPTQPMDITSTQGQQMARQSTSKSWTEAASARGRASGTDTPLDLGQSYETAFSSAPMSRKRARTSQYGPGATAKNSTSAHSFDSTKWQLDSNAPYCGIVSTSTSSPSFKARRTPAGRTPIKIQHSPDIRVYEPEEYLQQSRACQPSTFSPTTGPQSTLDTCCNPPLSRETPTPYPISPTTTASEIYNDITPPTSATMSRQDSLAASFCGAFGMMRADSGISEMNSGQNMYRQDSYSGLQSSTFSPDGHQVGVPFDTSLYFAHAEGTAIETSPDSMLAVEQLQLPTNLELDTEMKGDLASSYIPAVNQIQPLPTLDLHTKMERDASSVSDLSSTSRVSRRSQEQIAQAAARSIAPKDVAESTVSKQSSSPPSLPGSQDMLRQRSAPETKMQIPKLQYSRYTKEKLKCDRCNKNPDGYRGSHELHRHMALDHNSSRTAWVCVDISSDGFLSGCAACESKKPYGQDYNAAAHLRRFHFHPKSEVRRTNVNPEERRGGKGGGKDPPMSECRRWMEKIQVPGKDFMALADNAVNDAGDDTFDDDEASKEEQGEQDEMAENVFLPGNIQKTDDNLQLYDSATGSQVSTSPLDGVSNFKLATTDNRQFEDPQSSVQPVAVPFSQADFQSAFEMPLDTYFDGNAANFTSPSIDLAYSHPTFSSSAPAAFSFLNSDLADPASTLGNLASSNPDLLNLPSTMSTTSTAHTQEDFNNFHTSFIPSYGMPSPHNPQASYGLHDFTPFR